MAVGVRKSSGVPAMSRISPVGISSASSAVMRDDGNLQHMLEHRGFARQIEIGVVGQVQHRRRVGGRGVIDHQRVAVEPVVHHHIQRAGKSLVAVRTVQRQPQRLAVRLGLPHPVGEAARPAVQGVAAVVGRQSVLAPVEDEACAADAVGVAAGYRAEMPAVAEIGLQPIEPERHVAGAALDRHHQFGDPRAVLRDGRAKPVLLRRLNARTAAPSGM